MNSEKRKVHPSVLAVARSGFSLVELLIAVVVLGILSAMVLAAGTASQNRARVGVAQNDLDSLKNAVYQALMANPKFMKYTDSTIGAIELVVDAINLELDDAWQFEILDGGSGLKSGAIGYTATQRDPWGSPYCLYIYTDSCTTGYHDESGTPCKESDSVVTVVIASAGRNGTGVGLGANGNNIDANDTTNKLGSRDDMVNNTDGIDDMGVIVRNKNGQLLTATFGYDSASLGLMKGVQWVFGVNPAAGATVSGVYHDYTTGNPATPNKAASIDQFKVGSALVGTAITADNGFLTSTVEEGS